MGEVAVQRDEVNALVVARLHAEVAQLVVLLGDVQVMEADYANGVIEGLGIQVKFQQGSQLRVVDLEPSVQVVGSIASVQVDIGIGVTVVFKLTDGTFGSNLLVERAADFHIGGHDAQFLVGQQLSDVHFVRADGTRELLVIPQLQLSIGMSYVGCQVGLCLKCPLGIAAERAFQADVAQTGYRFWQCDEMIGDEVCQFMGDVQVGDVQVPHVLAVLGALHVSVGL